MGVRPGSHGRLRALQVAPWAALMLSLLIVMAVAGCGAQNGKRESRSSAENDSKSGARTATDEPERKASAQRSDGSSAKSTDTKTSSKTTSARAASQGYAAPAGPGNHVRITQEGCVQFEPRWASVHLGQPIVWTSALSAPVTIHVSPGAFDRSEFTVPAGASVTTGPARGSGSFSIWTDPASCQTVPRGVNGPGPGINVVAR
jgi:hypothetical protein